MKEWIVGFDKAVVTPKDYKETAYYSAGYMGGCRCTDVLDDMYVRSLWIDDNSGNGGVVLSVIDCVGMSNHDVLDIRSRLSEFSKRVSCRGINIAFTHCHSAADTQGLWGKLPKSGLVPHYMDRLKDTVAKSIVSAYYARKTGTLSVGDIKTEGLLEDTRAPMVFDDKATRVIFRPSDGTAGVMLVHFPVHPEVLGGRNPLISADFPAYMGKRIYEKTQMDFVYVTGAIGGLITCPGLDDIFEKRVDNVKACMEYGEKVADFVLSTENDIMLEPELEYINRKITVPVTNPKFVLASKFRLVTNDVFKSNEGNCRYCVPSELGYLSLGNFLRIMLIPGELYSELAYGGYLDAKYSATGTYMTGGSIFDYVPDGKKLILGLCNDELGYIIPENDFLLDKKLPYFVNGVDRFGEIHYEETNSIGCYAAEIILKESKRIFKRAGERHEQ